MLTTMPDLAWNVHVSSWNWVYTFSHKGTVSWRDPLNQMTGRGSWRIEGGKLVIRWHGSKTVEKWDLPIDPKAATGKCFMQEGTFDLTAEAINFIEFDEVIIFGRTPESKAKFLQSCADAVHDVQIAQLAFTVWLTGMANTYGKAFETHKKFLDDIFGTKKLAEELLLGFALAFVGGAAGGAVAGVMKQLTKSDIWIDGVKDLAKFSVRGPGAALLPGQGSPGMPASPLQWQNASAEKNTLTMLTVSTEIKGWRTAVESDDSSFDARFDPETEVLNALTIKLDTGKVLKFSDLPTLTDEVKASLQRDFQRGWLVAWIHLNARPVFAQDLLGCLIKGKVEDYTASLGDNDIKVLLDKEWPLYSLPPSRQ